MFRSEGQACNRSVTTIGFDHITALLGGRCLGERRRIEPATGASQLLK